jgi:hypothetical protein
MSSASDKYLESVKTYKSLRYYEPLRFNHKERITKITHKEAIKKLKVLGLPTRNIKESEHHPYQEHRL